MRIPGEVNGERGRWSGTPPFTFEKVRHPGIRHGIQRLFGATNLTF